MNTVGSIASMYGETPSRVRSAILKAGIKENGIAGRYRLYADEDLPAIRTELSKMARMVRAFPPTAEAR